MKNIMKKANWWLVASVFMFASCGPSKEDLQKEFEKFPTANSGTDNIKKELATLDAKRDSLAKINGEWTYDERTDEMSGKKSFFGYNQSEDVASFSFPYEGGSTLQIVVRKKDGVTDAMLIISKGQFIGSYNGKVRLKFDDEQAYSVGYSETSDGSSETIFLNGASSFISKLKKHKKLKIECEFYDQGRHIFNFNIEKLKWNH